MYSHLALSDQGFLFDTRTGNTYTLNRTATFLLKALMAGATEAALPQALEQQFEVDADSAAHDAEQFLYRLRDLRLCSVGGRSEVES